MLNRLLRVALLMVWLEIGLTLILVPWSYVWDANFFVYQYPGLGVFLGNPFLRGAISGLGFMNVFLSVGAFRRRAVIFAERA
jgi:hypothetical protein